MNSKTNNSIEDTLPLMLICEILSTIPWSLLARKFLKKFSSLSSFPLSFWKQIKPQGQRKKNCSGVNSANSE